MTIWLSYRELTASVLQFLGSARQFSETYQCMVVFQNLVSSLI